MSASIHRIPDRLCCQAVCDDPVLSRSTL